MDTLFSLFPEEDSHSLLLWVEIIDIELATLEISQNTPIIIEVTTI